MKILGTALSAALLILGLVTNGSAEELPRPKVIAVQVYAHWCDPCIEMEEAVSFLADRFDGEPILGIIFDVTNLSTRHHSRLLAGALELDDLYREKRGTLGEVWLVDAKSKALIETLTSADDFETMSAKVRSALESR